MRIDPNGISIGVLITSLIICYGAGHGIAPLILFEFAWINFEGIGVQLSSIIVGQILLIVSLFIRKKSLKLICSGLGIIFLSLGVYILGQSKDVIAFDLTIATGIPCFTFFIAFIYNVFMDTFIDSKNNETKNDT
jgi:hypothetical protein